MDRSKTAAPTRRLRRRLACALSATAAVAPLAACTVGPPSAAGGSATVQQAPASAVINIPATAKQPIATDTPIRVESGDGELTDVAVLRGSDGADIGGVDLENSAGETTAWETTEALDADESYTVAAVAESSGGAPTTEQVSVRTSRSGDGEAAGTVDGHDTGGTPSADNDAL